MRRVTAYEFIGTIWTGIAVLAFTEGEQALCLGLWAVATIYYGRAITTWVLTLGGANERSRKTSRRIV